VEYTVDDPARHATDPQYTSPPPGELPVNLIAIPPGERASRLGLFAHIDTEPAHPGWRSPPMRATAHNGRLYALGAADDKSGVAAAAVAAAVMRDARQRAPVIMSVHGKGGGARGTLPVFTRMQNLAGALYVHPAETGLGLSQIKHVSRGVLDLTLMVTGWHGPLREIGTLESASFAEGGDAFRAALVMIDRLRAGPFAGCDVNVGHIVAGERPGVVPLTCQIDVRVLFDGARTAADLVGAADAAIEECERELASPAGRFSVGSTMVVFRANPGVTAWNAPLSRVTREAVIRVTGRPPAPYTAHVASDLRFPLLVAGCPAVGLGPVAGGFYGADEWVDIDDLRRLVQVLVTAVQAWNDLEEQ
jgi:acetylornithine deacetylase/succinyl-diaminopimelate desuccinylase-like protein